MCRPSVKPQARGSRRPGVTLEAPRGAGHAGTGHCWQRGSQVRQHSEAHGSRDRYQRSGRDRRTSRPRSPSREARCPRLDLGFVHEQPVSACPPGLLTWDYGSDQSSGRPLERRIAGSQWPSGPFRSSGIGCDGCLVGGPACQVLHAVAETPARPGDQRRLRTLRSALSRGGRVPLTLPHDNRKSAQRRLTPMCPGHRTCQCVQDTGHGDQVHVMPEASLAE